MSPDDAVTGGPATDGPTIDADRPGRPRVVQRRLGTAMILVAVLGVVVSVGGTVIGWLLVGDVRATTGESLDITLEALDSVDDTIDLSEQVLDAITETVATTDSSLGAVDESFTAGSDVIAEVAELTDTVGPSLEDVAGVLRRLEGVGSSIDGILGELSRVPFGPDYDPDEQLGETLGELADTVAELPGQFSSTSDDLAGFDRSIATISDEIGALRVAVGDVRGGLVESRGLLAEYRANIDAARTVADGSRDDVDRDVGLMRLVIVLGGLTMAAGQIVPLWLGRRLRDGRLDRVL